MAEQSPDMLEPIDEAAVEVSELPREVTEHEKKLRREVVRYREEARIAVGERESARAAAIRDRDEAVAAVRADASGRLIQAELKSQAIQAGIVDLDGLRLAEIDGLSVNEAGDVQGAEEAIASLRKHKPYLFAVDRSGMATGTTAQLQRPPSPAQPSTVDARSLSREAWQAERDRLLSAPR